VRLNINSDRPPLGNLVQGPLSGHRHCPKVVGYRTQLEKVAYELNRRAAIAVPLDARDRKIGRANQLCQRNEIRTSRGCGPSRLQYGN